MWYTVPMSAPKELKAKGPMQDEQRTNQRRRLFADFPIAGRVLADLVRFNAPSPTEVRAMLIALRRDFGMARGHAAAFLGVAEATVKSWEKGTRCPSVLACRCIQFLDESLRRSA